MTRKHFILLAHSLLLITDRHARHDAACAISVACVEINPAFNRNRFLAACGVPW